MKNYIKKYMRQTIEMQNKMLADEELISSLQKAAQLVVECYSKGGKVMIAGNGGSAGDAQHIAGELINKFFMDRRGLACVALTTDTSVLTAVGNDYSFERVFSKQLEAIGKKNDVFIGISTSGNSKDVIAAMRMAKQMDIANIAFVGEKKCAMDDLSDCSVKIPDTCTPHIQEGHIVCYHILCALVEEAIFGKGFK